MEHRLFRQLAFNPIRRLVERYPTIDPASFDEIDQEQLKLIAEEVLAWAKKHGVTHYTFWIQPQTNETIEKHDAFFELEHLFHSGIKFKQVEKFTGKILQKGEGDGSSFPNGGLRGTEKARAYIAWDSKSDVFIREGTNKTLYIPAMLLTHDGEALDQKAYLRRAEAKLKQATSKILSLLGEREVKCVNYCLGIEQEFFIIRKEEYERRLDLTQTGRTLYGQLPPRNQQFSDHYYGKISDKIFDILSECENQLLRLGVPVKTKHKEVAVNQYEMSAYFEDAVTSVDHNMLVMDVLKSTFDKHGYVVLLHEKPFKSANGSGKHCNWSLQFSREGDFENLFEPGEQPEKNIKFLMFLLLTLKAVQRNAGLLKASITSASNEQRMGGHEAPPCIISVFLGSYIDRLLNCVEEGQPFTAQPIDLANLIPGLRTFMQDNTDRNRTSPFAFTGNKFEFRAVGSRQNVAFPMTVLAAILTKEINEASELLSKGTGAWDLIHKLIAETKPIRFEGDGYSHEWEIEAASRGLPHLKTVKESYDAIKNASVLKELSIFSGNELYAKYNILARAYEETKITEAKTLLVLLQQVFMPRLLNHLEVLGQFKGSSKRVFTKQYNKYQQYYEKLDGFVETLNELVQAIPKIETTEGRLQKATELRYKIDELSKLLGEVEVQLPRREDQPPQLFDLLNKY